MKSINFLQVVLAVAAAGILCLYNSPVHGDGGRQCVAAQENSAQVRKDGIFDAGIFNGKTAGEKEDYTIPADKEKPEEKTGEKVKDFCRLKDLR